MTTTPTLETVRSPAARSLTSVSPEMASSILSALADHFSEKIMTCTVTEARTVEEISSSEKIPLSTCYRRMRELVDAGLILVERIVITGSGKRYATYRSCFKSFRISSDFHGLSVEAEVNEDVADKLRDRWLSTRYA